MKPAIVLNLGAAAILAGLFFALLYAVPVRAAECVRASWYGKESCVNPKNCRTANGERYTGNDLTAAMPSRKYLGRHYRVTHGGKSVDVRINDVGPAKWTGRGIDLSKAAAKRLGMIDKGVGSVCLTRLR